MIINKHWRIWRCYPVCLAIFTASLLTGCGVYLHDDDLQKQTDIALSTYKTADIVGAMKSALDVQEQLNKAELLAVAEKETADRERAITDLISVYPGTRTPGVPKHAIDRLDYRVNERIKQLVGEEWFGIFISKDWLDYHEKIVVMTSVDDALLREKKKLLAKYRVSGGKNFSSCESFQPDNESQESISAATELKDKCDEIALAVEGYEEIQKVTDYVRKTNGEIASVNQKLDEVDQQIEEQTMLKNDADKKLNDAKKELEDASGKDPNANKAKISDKLTKLDSILKDDDKSKLLGDKLAAVQFRKANLRDVITKITPESDLNRSIAGVIAGLIDVSDISNPPSIPELSVALAFQVGKEKQVQAMLGALYQQQKLLQHEQDSLMRELELLAVAQDASQTAKLMSGPCNPIGFAEMFPNANCASAAHTAAARALSAYNFSWASGRTAAMLDEQKITQGIMWEKLRVAQEVAVARANIETIALTEIAAFGQGGIKPETIAAFLQAIAAAAIAGGVY